MRKRPYIKIAIGVVGLAAVIAVVTDASHTVVGYDCILCRSLRIDHQLFGVSWQTYRDTGVTEWYRTHQGSHAHHWERFSCLGRRLGCGIRHPVCESLPWGIELPFVERATPAELAEFFNGITSTERDAQRQAVELALQAWERNHVTKD